ncbi:MAG: hypothetical protein BGO67_03785 [Alphaproteobacteria bacterium 41-28]|nr:MAG: hypothetical protein BGO67_03785 [Alphaproteobacteria bacterium 41-28]
MNLKETKEILLWTSLIGKNLFSIHLLIPITKIIKLISQKILIQEWIQPGLCIKETAFIILPQLITIEAQAFSAHL